MADNDEKPNPPPPFYDPYGASLWRFREAATIENSMDNTLLIAKLRNLGDKAPPYFGDISSPNFSWTEPDEYGLPLNGLNPVPAPLNQEGDPRCIPFSILSLIRLQMNMHRILDADGNAFHHDVEPPLPVPDCGL
ncbi:hypothetical protein MKW98_004158 [Papaver atlanticum]|uniref:Uncharacterized protein n=1 Tax=Papaver atlanticum TaxID=357466 RepID=A0AAD4T1G6_9MAGN|nr:hypothetical protein MKW98_004158 [Papaver atlanticum]